MDTHSAPPLQFRCLSKTVILLFNRTDIKKCLLELGRYFLHPHGHLDCIAKRGKELASTLPIPDSVKNALIDVLRSMATEVFDWCIEHRHFISDDFDVFSSFHWRSDGTIDELKTAKSLIQRQDVDVHLRFKIASYHLLIDDAWRLHEEFPNYLNDYFISISDNIMISYWERRRPGIFSPISNSEQTLIIDGNCCIL
ncbi:hypothetical protein CEXT_432121 [Caerostris extrusa]|uniref:Uncharacterized protein n=1 Tax=Caerostris extrusa TaxID=172846 RepID=A0AAV4WYT7_CAEEX|nr:hypothetical protein CEXT_432121 [Caerostris extrusa]